MPRGQVFFSSSDSSLAYFVRMSNRVYLISVHNLELTPQVLPGMCAQDISEMAEIPFAAHVPQWG